MTGYELDQIKDALTALYGEFHNPGEHTREEIEQLYAKAVNAWLKLANSSRALSK